MSFAGVTDVAPGRLMPTTRSRIQGTATGMAYPNPFFDVGHTYLPTSMKELFKFCRYYFLTNGLLNTVAFKLTEYPITDAIFDHPSASLARWWEDYFTDTLQYRGFRVDAGLDYNVTGNSMSSVSFPFVKHLTCSSCGFTERADKIRPHWRCSNYNFHLTCPRCGNSGTAQVRDVYYKNASGIRLLRWNVEDISVLHNDITGECTYFYDIPNGIRSDVVIGKKDVVERMPQIFLQALRQQKGVVFNTDNFFHVKRSTLAMQDRGWGIPLIMPVLKDAFRLQLMQKAQETILLEHILPLRLLFPQAGSSATDPYSTINLTTWKEHVAAEIARWRYDPAYIPILPLPVGNQTVGGDGKALLLFQELQIQEDSIVTKCGVPLEFIKGGASWAGTNVSMRMVENMFIGVISRARQQANWVMKIIASYLDIPPATIRFKPFKAADDIQRKAYMFQLNQAGKISDTTLLADCDLTQRDEDNLMVAELDRRLEATRKNQLASAEVQGEQQLIMMKYQARAQRAQMIEQQAAPAPGEPGGPDGAGISPAQAQQYAAGAQQQQQKIQQRMADAPTMGAPTPTTTQESPDSALGGLPTESQSLLGQGNRLNNAMGVDLKQLAAGYAQQLSQMNQQTQQQALQAISAQSAELAQLVQQMLAVAPAQAAPGPDMRPLPEARAPRRTASPV